MSFNHSGKLLTMLSQLVSVEVSDKFSEVILISYCSGVHTLESVYRNSNLDCQQTFSKPVFTEESYMDVYKKIRIPLKPQQKECLK
jgi:hypothetical protein